MASIEKNDISQLEQTVSLPDDLNKDHIDYNRIDKELAQYASAGQVEITPEDDKRLKHMIDKRVLAVMIITYFLQAIDKVHPCWSLDRPHLLSDDELFQGTMSFASIMGIQEDLGLDVGQRVSQPRHATHLHANQYCSINGSPHVSTLLF